MPYLAIRGAQAFITKDGKHLTRQLFSSNLNTILKEMKIDTSKYNTHSFQIRAATSAKNWKKAGISDAHIQMLGRWKSQTYMLNIRTSSHAVQKTCYTMQQLDWSICKYHTYIRSYTPAHLSLLYTVFLFVMNLASRLYLFNNSITVTILDYKSPYHR